MANNRLRLKCICGESSLWFAKELGDGWYVQPAVEGIVVKQMNAFFMDHTDCSIRYDQPFVLEYETS